MKIRTLSLLVPLLLVACGKNATEQGTQSPQAAASIENPVSLVDGVTVVRMTANDRMQYNLETFTVAAGSRVQITLTNVGKMPKAAMGHNVVFLSAEADANVFAAAAASARDTDYLPADLSDQILAASQLLGPGESDTIEFPAPTRPGEYVFLCSFPAHMFAGMRGLMVVE